MRNKQPKLFIAFIIFALVGVGLCIGAFYMYTSDANFKKTALETSATIANINTYTKRDSNDDITTEHDVYVSFNVNGKDYYGNLGYYYTGMHEGQTVAILYNPNNPQDFRSKSGGIFGSAIMAFMGIAFFLIGLLSLLAQQKRKKQKEALLQNGKRVLATVMSVEQGNMRVNNRPCYNIICEYYDSSTDTTYKFKSDNIWQWMPQFSNENIASLPKIEVLIDYEDWTRYYVDIDNWLNSIGSVNNIGDPDATSGNFVDLT